MFAISSPLFESKAECLLHCYDVRWLWASLLQQKEKWFILHIIMFLLTMAVYLLSINTLHISVYWQSSSDCTWLSFCSKMESLNGEDDNVPGYNKRQWTVFYIDLLHQTSIRCALFLWSWSHLFVWGSGLSSHNRKQYQVKIIFKQWKCSRVIMKWWELRSVRRRSFRPIDQNSGTYPVYAILLQITVKKEKTLRRKQPYRHAITIVYRLKSRGSITNKLRVLKMNSERWVSSL